ncbi:tyrosine-type recombinase/integrase [Bradyrhizobium zhanjiangense]|uniref:Integrase n=1 Tax=Bradyrhizobium zhanjiangense TaxID=1325107 RepID=A0A4Q0RZN7_9BRAD|nr:tyrosine-type recombinase/integrase [Bradyrhizobium zhanjiangense]RXH25480.1 integrase [Bradyrhizobium zhanjiangense]
MTKSSEDHCHGLRCMDAGDLAPLVTEFTRHLTVLGHKSLTVSGYDAAARHLAQWLTLAKIAVADIDDGVADRFARHRCRCPGIRRERSVSAKYVRRVRRFIEFLGERGIVQRKPKPALPTPHRRVVEFQDWLRQHRGVTELTIDRHGRMVMRLLPALGIRPRSWNAQLIRDVIIAETKRVSLAYVKTMTMALRGYLRFLSARGVCRAGLDQAVPIIPQWRLSSLPRYIRSSDVETLIATCDQTTATGVRDRAILLLLARLGLRASDILSLRLTDIDWQQATLSVRGKGRRETRLPLPQDAGDAVLAYLDQARPHVVGGRIFFMLNAPIRPLTRSSVVSDVVRCAIRKAGITAPSNGANLLRHSAATAMLRGGATLDTVGAVLRHRSPDMTAHYAKVDVTMLLQIAQPWPGDA